FRALSETGHPSVSLVDYKANGRVDDYFVAGDTLRLTSFFTNYLAPASNVSIKATAMEPFIKIINNNISLGAMATMGSADNSQQPFLIHILKNAPINAEAKIKITVSDGAAYQADYFIMIPVNVDYMHLSINDIGTTVTSKGKIGYNHDGQAQGLGFTYKNHETLLYEAGLIMGTSQVQVSSSVRGDGDDDSDQDFTSVLRVDRAASKISALDLEGKFMDYNSSSPLIVSVNHNTYAWQEAGSRNYIIQLYDIINKGNARLDSFYFGIFADWDIMDYSKNRIHYDTENRMGYAFSTETGSLYAGLKLLSHTAGTYHYALDNIAGGDGGEDIRNGFDKAMKYRVISGRRQDAGLAPSGNDVIDVMSTGPFNISPGDTAFVAFALLAGESLEELQKGAKDAQHKYDNEIPHFRNHKPIDDNAVWLGNSFPNPARNTATIEFYVPEPMEVSLHIYNSLGQVVDVLYEGIAPEGLNKITVNGHNYQSGVYLFRLIAGTTAKTGKITFLEY
ncbi:MAG: T9SS type A sorting domain-containing protein, partial [Bacteroidetes bacterium]|nr:T9SS type A sorting domain-containing protein [Bacteroidota bacterium]